MGRLRELGDRVLRELRMAGRAGTVESVRAHYRVGDAAEKLAGLTRHIEAEVLVVGTRGRRGLRRWMHGSVAESILRRASCPVLVVRGPEAALRAAG